MPAILKGEVSYINGTTYLASQVSYECTPGNRISGHKVRFCGPDGRWTGTSPKCEEVRCDAPDMPANGSAIYIGNDRSFKEQSFSVGVTVQYECDYGHVVKGSWASRLCQATGDWSGEPPVCKFVDCGQPPTIENGNYVLKHPPAGSTVGSATPIELSRRSDNGGGAVGTFTYYGTIAHYSCDSNFKLTGQAQRECLETGQWRRPMPTCEPVQCPKPEFFDEYTQVALIPKGQMGGSDASSGSPTMSEHLTSNQLAAKSIRLIANNQWIHHDSSNLSFGVGDKLHFSCVPGYESYGGPEIRTCTQYGQWSGSSTPRCRLIDCGRPAPIGQEGRYYLLNETTTFNSLVEYSCVRPFKLVEVKIRQAGNLIETLTNAQAGVTPILTSLPIGVKVCANNGQWMPNDQQPRCTSDGVIPTDGSTSNTNGNNNGQFDGVDNTLDGSDRTPLHTSNSHSTTFIGSSQHNQDGDNSNSLDLPGGQRSQTSGGQSSSSLWAKIIIAICLLVMLALIILTLICIRSGKKPKQVIHRTSILTSSEHQAAAAAAAMQLQLAGSKGLGQAQPQQQVGVPAVPHGHHHLHQAHHLHHQSVAVAPGQNIYVNGMQKIFPGSMVGQSQMSSASYGDALGAAANRDSGTRAVVNANGRAEIMLNGKSNSLGVLGHQNRIRLGGGTTDHHQQAVTSISTSTIMDNYSRLSIDSTDQNNQVIGNNKTIRHNPNGLVTFVSPAQQQNNKINSQQQQPPISSSSSSGVSSTSHHHHHQHQTSPHSISTSLSVSASSSPSSTTSSSSAHHTSATRFSATDSTASPTSVHQHQQHIQPHHHHPHVNNNNTQQSEYQAPQQFLQPPDAAPPQSSPPSLPANPPPPHRVQQHHKQLLKHQAASPQRQQQDSANGNNQQQQQQHHYMDPSA